ncbi:tetratricopeptide repeat protein [bacterium]|nr:tetratricopeptide repeat protein [bacterium]
MKNLTIILFVFVFHTALLSAQVGLQRKTADKLYEQGDNYHAMQMYKKMLDQNPNDPELNYNVGNTLYRMQMYDQAAQYYERALTNTNDQQLKSDIQYNMANCLYKSKKIKESIEGYKQALRKNPNDEDARFNLEYAMKQIQQPPPPPQKNDSENSSEKKDKDSSKEQNQNKQQQDQKDNQNKEQREQEKNNQQQQQAQQQGLSKKEAEKILDALKNQERDYQKKQIKERATSEQKTEKDW